MVIRLFVYLQFMNNENININKSFGRRLLELYVYGSFHIGLSALLYTLFFFQYLEYTNWWYLSFIFFSTWAIYGAHKAIGISKVEGFLNQGRFAVIRLYRKHIFIYIAIGILGSIFTWFHLNFSIKLALLTLGIIPVLYVLPIFKGKKRLRDFGIVKIFLISIVWALVTTTSPMIGADFNHQIALFLASALYIFGITIPFDIRDLDIEEALDVKTIPSILGVTKSKILAISCLTTAGLMVLSIGPSSFGISFLISSLLCTAFVYFFSTKDNDFYYSLLLDATMMLPMIFYWIIEFTFH